jgi:hypothetical protein
MEINMSKKLKGWLSEINSAAPCQLMDSRGIVAGYCIGSALQHDNYSRHYDTGRELDRLIKRHGLEAVVEKVREFFIGPLEPM